MEEGLDWPSPSATPDLILPPPWCPQLLSGCPGPSRSVTACV